MSSINWIQSPVALTKNIPDMIFTSMYLVLTFESFEILGTETGTCSADWWIDCVHKIQTNVLCNRPQAQARGSESVLLHSTSFSPNIKWCLLREHFSIIHMHKWRVRKIQKYTEANIWIQVPLTTVWGQWQISEKIRRNLLKIEFKTFVPRFLECILSWCHMVLDFFF